jgi:hypothetical protein
VRQKQQLIRAADNDEAPLFQVGDQVLMVSKRQRKGQSKKLQPRFVGPYTVQEVWPNHTYRVQRGNQISVENEMRLKLFVPSSDPVGQAPGTCEPVRGPNRKGVGRGPAKSPPCPPIDQGLLGQPEGLAEPVGESHGEAVDSEVTVGRPKRQVVPPTRLLDYVLD